MQKFKLHIVLVTIIMALSLPMLTYGQSTIDDSIRLHIIESGDTLTEDFFVRAVAKKKYNDDEITIIIDPEIDNLTWSLSDDSIASIEYLSDRIKLILADGIDNKRLTLSAKLVSEDYTLEDEYSFIVNTMDSKPITPDPVEPIEPTDTGKDLRLHIIESGDTLTEDTFVRAVAKKKYGDDEITIIIDPEIDNLTWSLSDDSIASIEYLSDRIKLILADGIDNKRLTLAAKLVSEDYTLEDEYSFIVNTMDSKPIATPDEPTEPVKPDEPTVTIDNDDIRLHIIESGETLTEDTFVRAVAKMKHGDDEITIIIDPAVDNLTWSLSDNSIATIEYHSDRIKLVLAEGIDNKRLTLSSKLISEDYTLEDDYSFIVNTINSKPIATPDEPTTPVKPIDPTIISVHDDLRLDIIESGDRLTEDTYVRAVIKKKHNEDEITIILDPDEDNLKWYLSDDSIATIEEHSDKIKLILPDGVDNKRLTLTAIFENEGLKLSDTYTMTISTPEISKKASSKSNSKDKNSSKTKDSSSEKPKTTTITNDVNSNLSRDIIPNIPVSYNDLKDHWASKEVEMLTAKGIINGKKDGSFKPNDRVTYAEFIKMVVAIDAGNMSEVSPDDSWYTPYINKALEEKYIGYAPTNVNDAISREDMIIILSNVLKQSNTPLFQDNNKASTSFRDLDAMSTEATTALESISKYNIITGDEQGQINPKKDLSRAEAAVVIYKLLQNMMR